MLVKVKNTLVNKSHETKLPHRQPRLHEDMRKGKGELVFMGELISGMEIAAGCRISPAAYWNTRYSDR